MLKRKAIINNVLVYIGIPSPEELYEIILDEFHPLDKESLIHDLDFAFKHFNYVMATIWYSDPEYSNPYKVTFTKVTFTRELDENETSFNEWALYDPEYNLSHDVVIRALVELYK